MSMRAGEGEYTHESGPVQCVRWSKRKLSNRGKVRREVFRRVKVISSLSRKNAESEVHGEEAVTTVRGAQSFVLPKCYGYPSI